MYEKIAELNTEVIKGQVKKMVHSSVEGTLVEMDHTGVSVRWPKDITKALWDSKVSPATISELSKESVREKMKAGPAELREMKLKEAAKKLESADLLRFPV